MEVLKTSHLISRLLIFFHDSDKHPRVRMTTSTAFPKDQLFLLWSKGMLWYPNVVAISGLSVFYTTLEKVNSVHIYLSCIECIYIECVYIYIKFIYI